MELLFHIILYYYGIIILKCQPDNVEDLRSGSDLGYLAIVALRVPRMVIYSVMVTAVMGISRTMKMTLYCL